VEQELRAVLDLAAYIDPGTRAPAHPDLRSAFTALALAAFPVVEPRLTSNPALLDPCLEPRWSEPLTEASYADRLMQLSQNLDADEIASLLRRFAASHRLRIALREILPTSAGGASLEVAARELSDLAAATVAQALAVATREIEARFGRPMRDDGGRSSLAVIGMGKLGGRELNAGSDVDLVCFYDTDEGSADGSDEITLHEYWTRVVRRMAPLLEEVTAEGFVWRVDLRLRPEGTRGPLVNSLPAMLRYYESWGRLWERAAWTRARPIAGDRNLGETLLREMEPFVYRRRVDPRIADAMCSLVEQARAERGPDVARDLKLGPGGIRDLELFVQSLQLVWGGRDLALRVRPTLEALDRLRSHGFVTEREAVDLGEAYAMLRAAEHLVQNATGLQTHSLPLDAASQARLARCLGFDSWQAFDLRLREVRQRVMSCVEDLRPAEGRPPRWLPLLSAIDRGDAAEVRQLLQAELGDMATEELAQDMLSLVSRPDVLLGTVARETAPDHVEAILDALVESADPEQAARCLCAWSAHRSFRPVLASAMREPPTLMRRFITALGGSAFLGDMVVRQPELAEHVLFSRGMPSAQGAAQAVHREVDLLGPDDMLDPELVAGAIRRAKVRVTLEVALADIAEEVDVVDVTRVLSALADACVERALRVAAGRCDGVDGMCVLCVGKLGGNELGYGSDLDVLFVFEPGQGEDDGDVMVRRARQAQKTIRVLSGIHEEGAGYELDTRLRPSGSQGVLVTSLRSFARYHGMEEAGVVGVRAAPWERQTLLRARFCAGDADLGRRVIDVAQRAAYESGPPEPLEIHRLRLRLEQELGGERGGRFDIKLGRGGLMDIEFAVQMLQMRHGQNTQVRSQSTLEALNGLARSGALPSEDATQLREAYLFLRKLEQRLHVVHNTSIHLLEAEALGLLPLARRMGITGAPGRDASELLMDRYGQVTRATRATYLRVMGVELPT
jgi:[glutamine synthetase] adenylyltransferase / [glutamine synthetase]-adenylyl-L-tyrosine phosphorylase